MRPSFHWLLCLVAIFFLSRPSWATEDIQLVFVGDVMLADTPGKLIRAGKDPLRYFAAELRNADLAIGSLECVISSKGKPIDKPYTFRAPKRALPP